MLFHNSIWMYYAPFFIYHPILLSYYPYGETNYYIEGGNASMMIVCSHSIMFPHVYGWRFGRGHEGLLRYPMWRRPWRQASEAMRRFTCSGHTLQACGTDRTPSIGPSSQRSISSQRKILLESYPPVLAGLFDFFVGNLGCSCWLRLLWLLLRLRMWCILATVIYAEHEREKPSRRIRGWKYISPS